MEPQTEPAIIRIVVFALAVFSYTGLLACVWLVNTAIKAKEITPVAVSLIGSVFSLTLAALTGMTALLVSTKGVPAPVQAAVLPPVPQVIPAAIDPDAAGPPV